jgi:uncharacterized membrane protein YdjX (TVP38/TMEM64 family)
MFFIMIMIVAICAFPGMSVLELTCGFVLGFREGFAVCVISLVAGACASFWIGRNYMRGHITSYLEESEAHSFKLFLRSLERRNGVILLILFRLMFVPLFVKNYGPSILRTSFIHYLIAVLVTTPPFAALFTFMGSHMKNLADNGIAASGPASLSWMEIVPLVVSVVAGTVFSVLAYLEFITLKECDDGSPCGFEKIPTCDENGENSPVFESIGA